MAMNGVVLGQQMLAAIDQAVAASPSASQAQRQAIWIAIGNAIVSHIQLNAQVAVAVTSVSGVTTGLAVSGPGTGTGTIT